MRSNKITSFKQLHCDVLLRYCLSDMSNVNDASGGRAGFRLRSTPSPVLPLSLVSNPSCLGLTCPTGSTSTSPGNCAWHWKAQRNSNRISQAQHNVSFSHQNASCRKKTFRKRRRAWTINYIGEREPIKKIFRAALLVEWRHTYRICD